MRTWRHSSKTAATAVMVFLAACVGSPGATALQLKRSELYIAVSEVRTEHSRDSYSITKTVIVKNGVLTYDESSRRKKPVHQEYNLTNDELQRLEGLIVKSKLLTSKSISGPEASGPHMSLDLSVETRLRKKRGSIKISGAETEELKTNQVYVNANALLAMLTDLIAARSHNEGGDSRNFTQYNFQVLHDDVFMLGRDGTVTGNRIAPVRSSSPVLVLFNMRPLFGFKPNSSVGASPRRVQIDRQKLDHWHSLHRPSAPTRADSQSCYGREYP